MAEQTNKHEMEASNICGQNPQPCDMCGKVAILHLDSEAGLWFVCDKCDSEEED